MQAAIGTVDRFVASSWGMFSWVFIEKCLPYTYAPEPYDGLGVVFCVSVVYTQ